MKSILITATLLLLLGSCKQYEHINPFDSTCPKEFWTPANFKAALEGTTVKLTWTQPLTMISGFKVTKKVGDAAESALSSPGKDILQLSDNELTGGKLHTYTILAYAGNNQSNSVTVQITPTFMATLSSMNLSDLTPNSAVIIDTVKSDGGAAITARGVCWNTSGNPTISNSKTTNGSGTGSFSSDISGLVNNTTYYLRGYATNSAGTAYSNELIIKTLLPNTVIDADGNVYRTVTIGSQVWMAENLKTTRYRNGDPIPNWTSNSRGYCWYNNDINNKNIYGAIYNFYTATESRSICPKGWHIPNDAEWTILINYLGGESFAGGKIKESGMAHWVSPNTGATNSSGFTALPGGARDCSSNSVGLGTVTQWWSSSSANGGMVSAFAVTYDGSKLYGGKSFDCNAFYVRCIKD